jgi:ketosteroid isomerase-like protein
MSPDNEVMTAEGEFFDALLQGDREQLEGVLGPDFVLIDVMTGSEIPRPVIVDLVGSGQLAFDSIERLEARVRHYADAAVVTGATRMGGRYGEQAFGAHSRYTHVYVRGTDRWRLVSAQGTPIQLQ